MFNSLALSASFVRSVTSTCICKRYWRKYRWCFNANHLDIRKWAADGDGDPTVFFKDVLTCLRLPACDQLLIVDCCFAAKAFVRQHIGKRKFELLTSAGPREKVPSPKMPGSFTKCLNEVLKKLLSSHPRGFSTSHLYRELYHAIPFQPETLPRPLLFDQARHSYGKIWLRPQQVAYAPQKANEEDPSTHLKLTLRLNSEPDNVLMNELAMALQYLPHVDQVRFDSLYAPKRQIESFMKLIMQTQKLRPLIRKLHAKRRLKKVMAINQDEPVKSPPSMVKMLLEQEQKNQSLCDWSSAIKEDGPSPRPKGLALVGMFKISSDTHSWRRHFHSDETWHVMMWIATFLGLGSLCFVMKE